MHIYAENFRGFERVDIDLKKATFLVGDNSSGKSSIIYMIEAISRNDLVTPPQFDEEFGVSEYDYFSPYFEYADVLFSYYGDVEEGFFAKIITVHEDRKFGPMIIRCSYVLDSTILTLKVHGKETRIRLTDCGAEKNISKLSEIHKRNGGFRKGELLKESSIGEPFQAIMNLRDSEVPSKFRQTIFSTRLDRPRLVSPIRALPEKFYTFKRSFNAQGRHFASMWLDIFADHESKVYKNISQFGKESGMFDEVGVRKLSGRLRESPLVAFIKKNEKEFLLHQVGIGVSQVVPVLMDSAYAVVSGDTTLLVQQPELHLHPVAQAALGSYLYRAANLGLRGIYETHSSFLLDRFRVEFRDQEDQENVLRSDDVLILFCENTENGNVVNEVQLKKDGSLYGEPESYHRFFVDELVRTLF